MRLMSPRRLLALVCLAGVACASDPKVVVHTTDDTKYTVRGNQVFDQDGKLHYFHGVARPSLEWSASGDYLSATDYNLMATWKANVVRIAVNQDFWLFGQGAPAYRQTVLQSVEWAKAAGMDVILDLHWSDRGDEKTVKPDQQNMADRNSVTFWKSVAETYKDDGRVLFELYNEPHDISWDVWLNGGTAAVRDGTSFTAVGMQELYDTVRATGADNLVIIGGLDWAYDLSGVATHLVRGTNIMYATHPYDRNNWKPVSSFDAKWGYLTASYPVIVTEFGAFDCSTEYTSQVIDYADRAGAHWTAWAWWVGGCNFPSLLVDWNGTPSEPGKVVKAALERYAAQGKPITQDGGIVQPKLDANPADLPFAEVASDGGALDQGGSLDTTSIDVTAIDGLGAIDLPLFVDAPLPDAPAAMDLPALDTASVETRID